MLALPSTGENPKRVIRAGTDTPGAALPVFCSRTFAIVVRDVSFST
jgi:hypothetical protein